MNIDLIKVSMKEDMAKKETDFKYIMRLDSELNHIQDFDLLLERILFEARKVVHADAGSIYVTAPSDNPDVDGPEKLSIKYSQNDTIQKTLAPGEKMIYSIFSVAINEKSISGYCGLTKKLINIPDMYNIPEDAPYSFYSSFDRLTGYKTTSSLTIPLLSTEERLMGVIQVLNATDSAGNVVPFSADDEVLITHFATNAAITLQRAYITRAMILRMIKMSELRDPKETGTHVNRVAGYAVEIYDRWAFHHNVPKEEQEKFKDILKISSMLHDVGKVAISDAILKKPARFTPEEFQIMQNHTVYGAGLFNDTHSTVDLLAMEIAMTHHENWDGTGYPGWLDPVSGHALRTDAEGKPLGRKGEEIPLGGRIVAIADVFDALCSKRVYKEPWSEEQVLEEMRKLSGTKFDPELIDIFFEILPRIKHTQSMYPETA
ncbi:MAG: HD domain-containing protein [Treponema sp.]|jgi:HD-GYP domain-containing protein (c-di-GMP phosphodiesterase class II)|nr:HD domain-containing protein [Treponema sp.]